MTIRTKFYVFLHRLINPNRECRNCGWRLPLKYGFCNVCRGSK